MNSFNDKGIIIRINPLNETDNVIVIFSENHGRVNAKAKGIKKTTSRRAGSLDLFNYIDFRVYQGKGDLDLLTEVKLIDDFKLLKTDFDIINLNYYVLELIDKTIAGHEKNYALFEALKAFFELQNGQMSQCLELITIMQIKLLDQLGYTPLLDECIVCNDKFVEGEERIPSNGDQIGYICQKHMPQTTHELIVDDVILKIQKFIIGHNMFTASRLKVDSRQMKSLFAIQHSWLQNIIEKKINTADIINSILIKIV
jgi:DNA repair protein RecO (recombination protein O)